MSRSVRSPRLRTKEIIGSSRPGTRQQNFSMWRVWRAKVIVLVCAALVVSNVVIWISSTRGTSDCLATDGSESAVFHARKVVVRPWLGQHHVYGIFVVPRDKNRFRATMIIHGLDDRLKVEPGGEVIHDTDVVTREGYYSKLVYLPTRRMLWEALRGQFWVIQNPCNWMLEFLECPQSLCPNKGDGGSSGVL